MTASRRIAPVENPTHPYWLSQPHRLASYRSSETAPSEVDIAIIGTGLSGVATAYHILKNCKQGKAPTIVLFEARQACSGATGRNGGHNKSPMPSVKNVSDNLGEEAAAEMYDWVAAQRKGMKDTSDAEGIDCDMLLTRSYDIYFDQEHADSMKKWFFEQQRKGLGWTSEVQWLEGPNLERITGIKGAYGATNVPALSFWPYKFVMGLLERVINLGGTLYTETLVHKTTSDGTSTRLSTSRGTTLAKKVIHATNGYAAGLLPQLQDIIVPTRGQASNLVPNPQTHHGFQPTTTYNLFYKAGVADYLNPRPDGTIVLGGGMRDLRAGLGDRSDKWWDNLDDSRLIDPAVKEHFDKTMETCFRGWEKSEAKVDVTWTGIMGSTKDSAPHVGLVPGTDNQWILAGFNGGGMAYIFTLTTAIARMVMNGDTFEETGVPKRFQTTQERLLSMRY